MSPEQTKKAIASLLETLRVYLADAHECACDAEKAIVQQGDQNQAIGTILQLEETLANVTSLYRAAIALHREGRT
jgi:hypothetical protein